jgi:hypothetical protein
VEAGEAVAGGVDEGRIGSKRVTEGSVVLSFVVAALVATGAVTISTAVVVRGWRLKP